MAAYPLVPRAEVGFRIQTTAANTETQIEHLCDVLGELAGEFELKSESEAQAPGDLEHT
jgi:hypothetical protein